MTQDYRTPAEEHEKFQTYHELLDEKFQQEKRNIFNVFSPTYGNALVRRNANRTWWINMDYHAEGNYRVDIEIAETKATFHWKKLTKSEGPQSFTYEDIPMEEAPVSIDLRELITGANKIEKMERTCPYQIKGTPALRLQRIGEVEKMMRQSKSASGVCPTTWGFMKIFPKIEPDKKISYRIEIEEYDKPQIYIIEINRDGKITHFIRPPLERAASPTMLDEALETAMIPEIYRTPETEPAEHDTRPEESAPASGIIAKIRRKLKL